MSTVKIKKTAKKTAKNAEATAPRKSVIRRDIKRTLSTAQYETLVIEVGIEEEIEWNNLEERHTKINNWNTLLIQDFKESSDRILEELGITHKKAYFKNPTEETKAKYQKPAQAQAKKEDTFNLDDLDSLDFITDVEPQVGRGLELED